MGLKLALVNLTKGGLSGGSAKYLRHLVPLLRADARIARLDVFVPPQAVDTLDLDLPLNSWPTTDVMLGSPHLRGALRKLAPDVVFIPNAMWIQCDAPVVSMVRNMEPLTAPVGRNSPWEALKNLIRIQTARRACRQADRIIAVSQCVRDAVVAKWGAPAHRVSVVPHGVDLPTPDTEERRPRVLHGVEDSPFLFTVGSIRPYRGLEDAIHGLAQLSRLGASYRLVLGGRPLDAGSVGYLRFLESLARECGVAERVLWAGQMSAAEIAWCFRRCEAFLMTSRTEACPNVVLEAMSFGCRSVSTDQPPMPEFYGDAALYYPAGDAQALARQVLALRSASAAEAARQGEAAIARARQFSWRASLEGTITALHLAVHPGAERPSAAALES